MRVEPMQQATPLSFELACGMVESLEEPISGHTPDCVRVLVDDREWWLQGRGEGEVTEAY